MRVELPLFPLKLVLFDGSLEELVIFEPRYLRMVRQAIADDTGFGIVFLNQGSDEVQGDNDVPEFATVGTLVSITQHEVLAENRILIVVEGGPKFRIHSTWMEDDQLTMSLVDFLGNDRKLPWRKKDQHLLMFFNQMNELRIADNQSSISLEENNASALSFRLAEILPMSGDYRQRLLELDNPYTRLDLIQKWLLVQQKKFD